jgi:phosphoribosylaminoimidazolecarboxamide formyltransferase/IMP cyclohydrolase
MAKRALISVSDKSGIVDFAQSLVALGWEIVSTGGTKRVLDAAGVPTISVEEVTGFPEMMDGRVKTLHPAIHGALLARRDLPEHIKAMEEHNIQPIDLVVVNLYPFKQTVLSGADHETIIENIDIGGPSMVRSAAKNHAFVAIVVDPADYARVLGEIAETGDTTLATREKLAAKAFRHTAAYDALIAQYMTAKFGGSVSESTAAPEALTITYNLKQDLRYGENPHQKAEFYASGMPVEYSIAASKQTHGKELSYNNIRDADAAIQIARDFSGHDAQPTVVALKHMNPCGIGTGATLEQAWDYAFEADPVSIYGGIIVLNRQVDAATAAKMKPIFLEIIIAPSFSPEALEILTKKKNLRLLTLDFDAAEASTKAPAYMGVLGGLLVQNQDVIDEDPSTWTVPTDAKPSEVQMKALEFAWKSVKFVKSNAIIVTNDHQTLGVGAGQTNRVDSVAIAVDKAAASAWVKEHGFGGVALASDAYFPFADDVDALAKAGIKAVVTPGGSIRDAEVIEACNKYGIAMVFTGSRHFRH